LEADRENFRREWFVVSDAEPPGRAAEKHLQDTVTTNTARGAKTSLLEALRVHQALSST